jgi:hypothetical protein
VTQLAAPEATLLITAFKAGRRIALPRGMNQAAVVALLGDRWDLEESRSVATEEMPAFLRPANPNPPRVSQRSTSSSQVAGSDSAPAAPH